MPVPASQFRSGHRFRLVLFPHQADFPHAAILLRLIGNFGLAILLLTLIIKLLFFPLAKILFAMSKMKLLQPEMQKIASGFPRTRHASSRNMAMYKKVGANPLPAACDRDPDPVFFSLYKVLFS